MTELYEALYEELRAMARREVRRWQPGQTLQGTALADELYLKLLHGANLQWPDRRSFVDAAAVAMHRIMIDHHRRKAKQVQRLQLPEDGPEQAAPGSGAIDPLDLKLLLDEYERSCPRGAQAVRFRYVLGLPMDQVAALLEVSRATAERELARAREWLKGRLFRD
jgi:RNA polymerase sigma factor (TIGR02999 family)